MKMKLSFKLNNCFTILKNLDAVFENWVIFVDEVEIFAITMELHLLFLKYYCCNGAYESVYL